MVVTDGSDGLIADISGVAHLFGGEEDLRADLQSRLDRAGITGVSAIAGTRGAAYALARNGGGVIPDGLLAEGIGRLPITALRVDPDTTGALSRLGLNQIRDILPLPRAPLSRRFGPGLLLRLDQALGVQAEPVAATPEAPHFGVRMTLPEPIGLQTDVMAGLRRLLDRLCDTLALHHMGARRVRLELRRVDRGSVRVEIGLARPMRDPNRIEALFRKGVDEIDAGFGIDALRLSVPIAEPLAPEQIGRDPTVPHEDALADLISRLGNRIGFDRVLRFLPAGSKIPERSFLLAPASCSEPAEAFPRTDPERPITLFPPEAITVSGGRSGRPPVSFTWRRMRFSTLRATGPERIAREWWFDDPAWRSGLRDYWRIETREGPRFWLFHTPQAFARPAPSGAQNWYAQGEFA